MQIFAVLSVLEKYLSFFLVTVDSGTVFIFANLIKHLSCKIVHGFVRERERNRDKCDFNWIFRMVILGMEAVK